MGLLLDLFDYDNSIEQELERLRQEELKKQQAEMIRQEQIRRSKEGTRTEEEKAKLSLEKGIAFGQHPASQGTVGLSNAQPIPDATLMPSAVSRGDGNPVSTTALPQFDRQQPTNNVRVAPQMNLGSPPQPVFLPDNPSPLDQVLKMVIGGGQQENPFDRLLWGEQTSQREPRLPTQRAQQKRSPLQNYSSVATALGGLGSGFGERMENLQAGAAHAYPDNPLMQQVAISQAILESGLQGKGSSLANKYNNLFGIKGKGTAGSVNMPTKEFMGGRMQSVNDNFARNATVGDSFSQHRNLMNKPRYNSVLGATNPMDAFSALKKSGYATDPNYAGKLYNIFNQYVKPRY